MNEHHYQRIDKGIKRHTTESAKPTTVIDQGSSTIPPGLDPHAILERYLSEATTSGIAKDYGLTRHTLVRWLRTQLPHEWKQAQIVRALCRKDGADEGLEGAADALSLARARELLKSGQWDLERLDSANYGPKQEVTHTIIPSFNVVLKGNDDANCVISAVMSPVSTHSQPGEPIDAQVIDSTGQSMLSPPQGKTGVVPRGG